MKKLYWLVQTKMKKSFTPVVIEGGPEVFSLQHLDPTDRFEYFIATKINHSEIDDWWSGLIYEEGVTDSTIMLTHDEYLDVMDLKGEVVALTETTNDEIVKYLNEKKDIDEALKFI